jgi:formylglycine-generating enzyme
MMTRFSPPAVATMVALLMLGCPRSNADRESADLRGPRQTANESAPPLPSVEPIGSGGSESPSVADAASESAMLQTGALSDGGPTGMDAAVDASSSSGCPEQMARIGLLCIDRYEAAIISRDDAGAEVTHPHYERPSDDVAYEARSLQGVFPQAYISRVQAGVACKNAGKRLCTLGEWQRACQGRRGWTYPYGNTHRAGKCNSGKPHLLSKMFGADAHAWKYDEHFNSPSLNQEPGFLARTGEYSACANEEGIFDMVGNLHEWVRDSVTDEFLEKLANDGVERRDQPTRLGNGVFMSGFFSTGSEHGPGCKFITIAHEPTYHDYSVGFRCCLSMPKAAQP